MPTTTPSRRTVFTDQAEARIALFGDEIELPEIDILPIVVDSTRDATITEVRILLGVDGEYHVLKGRGTALRAQGDAYDGRVAHRIALARALDSLSAKLKRQANGYMDHTEWVAADQARRKEENAVKSEIGRLKAAERDIQEELHEKLYDIDIPDESVEAIIDELAADDGTRSALETLFGRVQN